MTGISGVRIRRSIMKQISYLVLKYMSFLRHCLACVTTVFGSATSSASRVTCGDLATQRGRRHASPLLLYTKVQYLYLRVSSALGPVLGLQLNTNSFRPQHMEWELIHLHPLSRPAPTQQFPLLALLSCPRSRRLRA